MILKFFGLTLLMGCLVIIYLFESAALFTGALRVIHIPAINLTLLGPLGLVLFSVEYPVLKATMKRLFLSPGKKKIKYDQSLDQLTSITSQFYARGPSALQAVNTTNNIKMEKLIERLSMKIPLKDIKNMMLIEKDKESSQLGQSISIMGLGVRYSPSIGMLGTILGMVQLLSSISDPSHIGSHMSLALLTTFFGLFFSLVVWSPFQHRLQSLKEVEIDFFDHIIHWVELMESRKPAHYFEEVQNTTGNRKPMRDGHV